MEDGVLLTWNGFARNPRHDRGDAVHSFIQRHAGKILGVLSGFDRLVFRGGLRWISYLDGMNHFLSKQGVLLKDFREYALGVTSQLRIASEKSATDVGRPVEHLNSPKTNKEVVALKIAARDNVKEGLIAVLKCVEPCKSYEIYKNRETKRLELRPRLTTCLYHYRYMIDPVFGFMNARIQTHFPFNTQVCINGREWLAREMDREGISYERRDNCFAAIENMERGQALMDRQVDTAWPTELNRLARLLNPVHEEIFAKTPIDYYWSVYQSEWATDIMLRKPADLDELFGPLAHHALTTFSSGDVMRFLGRSLRGGFEGEIVSDFKDRPEGVRIKHSVDWNSVKAYGKQASVFRIETTINDPTAFRAFRTAEGKPKGERKWRPLRKGIADLHRLTQVSQAANERYGEALGSVSIPTRLADLIDKISRPITWRGQRVRGLAPWSDDVDLVRAVARGEFCINGFRNRDLADVLLKRTAKSAIERRRQSARVTRLIRMLRAHGLVRKLSGMRRYKITPHGREVLTAVLAAQDVTLEQLSKAVA
jgi:hypothetical protein